MPRMRKRLPLVCEHLENISRDALEKHQNVIRSYVRRRQGVYALYRKSKLYYVGLAKDLRWRLKAHVRIAMVNLGIDLVCTSRLETSTSRSWSPSSSESPNRRVTRSRASSRSRRICDPSLHATSAHSTGETLPCCLVESGRTHWLSETGTNLPFAHRFLAAYFTAPKRLRANHKGKTFRAHVRRDGSIRFGGKVYDSPSAAGSAAVRRSCNGWSFWKYERAPGDWIRLSELRK